MEMFRRGAFPSCFPAAPQCTLLSLAHTVTGWGQSCPAGSVLGSSRLALGGVPILEGPPSTAGDKRVTLSSRSGVGFTGTRACPKSPEAGGLHP